MYNNIYTCDSYVCGDRVVLDGDVEGMKKRTLSFLKKKLDRIFSEFIRRRDANPEGFCRCITCGNLIQWKYETHAGHFQERSKLSTRFTEKNVHSQCISCNSYHAGRQYKYGKILDQKYGAGTADMLEGLPKDGFTISRGEYEDMIEDYTKRVKVQREVMGED